jgi:hypothetical protein
MHRVTGLGRPIDLRYPSNRFIVAVALISSVVAYVFADSEPVRAAVTVGGSAFLGWAIAREIDPDRTLSAAVAGPTSAALGWLAHSQGTAVSLGTLYLVLIAVRVVVRSTGLPPTRLDLGLHLAIVAFLAAGPHAWPAAVVMAVAVVRDTRLPDPAPAANLMWGAAIGVVAALVAGVASAPTQWVVPDATGAALLVSGVIGTAVLVRPQSVTSPADFGGRPIDPLRLAMGRLTAGSGAVLVALVGGAAGLWAVAPAFVAIAASAAVRLARRSPPAPS